MSTNNGVFLGILARRLAERVITANSLRRSADHLWSAVDWHHLWSSAV